MSLLTELIKGWVSASATHIPLLTELTALFTSIEPGRGKTLRVFLNPEGFNANK
jgi:hypothetical protein